MIVLNKMVETFGLSMTIALGSSFLALLLIIVKRVRMEKRQ
jgi:hypothetical protein